MYGKGLWFRREYFHKGLLGCALLMATHQKDNVTPRRDGPYINPRRYDGVLGFIFNRTTTMKRLPLSTITIILFIAVVGCAVGLVLLATGVIVGL